MALVFAGILLLAEARAAPAEAGGLSAAAAEHLARATRYFEQGHYQAAIDECILGNSIEISVDFYYLLGQAERLRGNCRRAIGYYQSALALAHSDRQAGLIRLQLERCRRERPGTLPATSRGAAAPAAPAGRRLDLAGASPAPARPRPWYKDGAGGLLAGLGVVALGVGAGLLGSSFGTVHDWDIDTRHYLGAREAEGRYQAGAVLLGVGGAALLAGTLRYLLLARRRHVR